MVTHKAIQHISGLLQLQESSVRNTIHLLEEGATVPFISRYRKEKTGSLDEVQILNIQKALKSFKDLESRKETILAAIIEQGKLTPALEQKIKNTYDSVALEDLYLPYKRKRKTKAGVARENGLEPLAIGIKTQRIQNLKSEAKKYLGTNVKSIQDAIEGAKFIIAEWISEDEKIRDRTRSTMRKNGILTSKVVKSKKEEAQKYRDYFDFEEKIAKCPSHRLLAMLRGSNEKLLRVNLTIDNERMVESIHRKYVSAHAPCAMELKEAIEDGYKRLILPSVENQITNEFKEKADLIAIDVFVKNLKQLLLSAPLGQVPTLAIDPGFRTGCKTVALDQNGNLLKYATIFPNPPQSDYTKSSEVIKSMVTKYGLKAVAVGNGTAGRETESFVKSLNLDVDIFMVNEDGASIYSASTIAREEFPTEDITVRGAVSIGRRLMDPLAELVKIDAKSIGVGQYQHDINQSLLKESLDNTVINCVNSVGININTASKHLLTYVSGLGDTLAKNIVDYRNANGNFTSKSQLHKVPRLGAKAFEQSAGFLRIKNGKNPLEDTGVHPEAYPIVDTMAKDLKKQVTDLVNNSTLLNQIDLRQYCSSQFGLPTLKDIIKELEKPGLDPRGAVSTFSFDNRVRTIEDVREGMILPGIVTNITNFGAFIDIGIKQGGLVHISQIANKYVSNPADVLNLQEQVTVKVLEVDIKRGRINLSMKDVN
ncbi:MAG: Tex family protein [Saprospiraceae bacterium]|nr:Tex family protein [Saprospiraceae bacterium]